VTARLIAEGRDEAEPAAVVERGTLPGQRTVSGTLGDIAERAAGAGVRPPALTVVGSVAALSQELAWVDKRPLHGTTVAVTRARAQASGLARRLAELGAEVVETPAIRIEARPVEGEIAAAVEQMPDYAVVCVTSPNGASLLLDALASRGRDARVLAGCVVAAIGPGTAAALLEGGIRADVVPERSVAEALVEALETVEVKGRRVLVARASEARDVLPEALEARGAQVDVLPLYDTVAEPLDAGRAEAIGRADYVTFTSSSTVRFFLDALAAARVALPETARVVSIGPVTSATAAELGLEVHVEAERHDIEGLVEALLADTAGL
jgi:uroporphyrinogen III methyltransferase/synthase